MEHDHHHGHHHHHSLSGRNLFIATFLNLLITVAQVVGGFISGSLALLSDALHNFSDVMALLISYGANRLAARPATQTRTFGFRRAEIIAAFINGGVLFFIGGWLLFEAYQRFRNPEPIDPFWVVSLGLLSIVANGISVWLLFHDAKHNLNVRSAFLHLLTDMLTSVAVLFGGLAIYFAHIYWIDSVITVLIALYLIGATFRLLGETLGILMQFAPGHLDLGEIKTAVTGFDHVADLHHVHLWQLDDRHVYLEAHLVFDSDIPLSQVTRITDTISGHLRQTFGITHITLQGEYLPDHGGGLIHAHD